jgi:glycosyltransferase involved in cell wall biosynthesis
MVRVTVLMPAYNAGSYIGEAVQSVLDQTFTDFELLIVNDGSTDNTLEILNSFNDPRIRIINRSNGGVSAALNTGIENSVTNLIARFDADDLCMPDRLEKQVAFMAENPDYILIGSNAEYITEEGEYIFTYEIANYSNEQIQQDILKGCPFIHSTVCYRRSAVRAAGGYEEKAHTFEDYFLWTKLIRFGKVRNFSEALIKVRFNPSSVTIDEKDYDPLFRKLKRKALVTGVITDEEGELIRRSASRLTYKKKEASYFRMLGKKFLWNNYQPGRARKSFLKSIKREPFSFTSYVLFFLSVFPENIIKMIYHKKKTSER